MYIPFDNSYENSHNSYFINFSSGVYKILPPPPWEWEGRLWNLKNSN